MILPDFTYKQAASVQEACTFIRDAAAAGRNARIYAGGTDLINFIKTGAIRPDILVDIKEIKGLDGISYDPEKGLTIGALTKLRDIETSPVVKKYVPVLSDAVHLIASTQIRSKGTLAGNVCNASPSADSVPSLFVLDAQLVISNGAEERIVPINEFYCGFKKTVLAADEMVTAIRIPPVKSSESVCYLAHTVRKAMDLAIVGVAVKLTLDAEDICTDAQIALGAVAVNCVRAKQAEAYLIGKKITPEVAAEAGVRAMADCKPISDVRASAEYRHDMVRVFTKRAITQALNRSKEVNA